MKTDKKRARHIEAQLKTMRHKFHAGENCYASLLELAIEASYDIEDLLFGASLAIDKATDRGIEHGFPAGVSLDGCRVLMGAMHTATSSLV